MPTHDYRCKCGETTEQGHTGYDVAVIPCPLCGGSAKRQEIYEDQYTRTDSAGMQGRMGRAGTLSEQAERFARNSDTIRKETGRRSGLGLR